MSIIVKKEEDFSVRFYREGGLGASAAFAGISATAGSVASRDIATRSATGLGKLAPSPTPASQAVGGAAIAIGVLVMLAQANAQASNDAQLEEALKPMVGDYDLKKLMEERLRYYLQSSKVFNTVLSTEVESQKVVEGEKTDAVLEVTLKQWGLRACSRGFGGEGLQIGVKVHGTMLLLENSSTIWERNELYLDGECHPLEAFQTHEGMLKDKLAKTVDNLAGKLVNEILFP